MIQVATQIVPIQPSMEDPLGHNTHLVALHFRDEADRDSGIAPIPVYALYSQTDNSIGQITGDYAGRMALRAVMIGAERSLPAEKKA